MKLLEGLKYAFDSVPKTDVKNFLQEERTKLGDEAFCSIMCSFFGGRGYNQLMDYKLLAIKLSKIFDNYRIKNYHERTNTWINDEIVTKLFFDDRHDMYQNIPYYIKDLIEINPDYKSEILSIFASGLIDSFNTSGTEDSFSENMKVPEK